MWIFNDNTGELKYHGDLVVRLSHSETIVLSLLISERGQLVMKDTLLDLGWPNKVVAPNSLTVAIKNIRKALKSINTEIYIETIYRRGYILHHNDSIEISSEENKNIDVTTPDAWGGDITLLIPAMQEYIPTLNSNNVDEGYTANNRHEIPAKNNALLSFVRCFKISKIIFYAAFFLSAMLFFIVFFTRGDIYCFTLDDARARACGFFKLSEHKKQKVIAVIGERPGIFLYGYNDTLENIEIYQVEQFDNPDFIWSTSIY